MPEAMLPAVVRVWCAERGRSERACAQGEHGVNYGGDGPQRGRRACASSFAAAGSRLRQLIVRFSDQELGEIRAQLQRLAWRTVPG
jgi:hypothetical protein